MEQAFDTIIIGLGAMGSAAAYQLALRGQRVLGLERHTPAHNLGSSHGESRIIRQAYFEDPAYVPLVLRAYELWRQLEHETGKQLLHITGGLMIGTATNPVITGSLQSAREHNLPHEVLNANEIRQRFPPFTPSADEIAVYERQAGYLRPELAVQACLEQAAHHGATLQFEETALHWEAFPGSDGVRVTTAKGSYEAARLIITPGAWVPELMIDLDLPLTVTRRVMYWFAPEGGIAPFLAKHFPIYIWGFGASNIYGFPALAGDVGGIKVAFHHDETVVDVGCTPDTIQRTVHLDEIARMRGALAERIPTLNGALLHTATCMYTMTPDEHFIVGLHPQHPQVVIASPCSGHGFKFASVIGEILADLAVDGRTRHEIAAFAPGRF